MPTHNILNVIMNELARVYVVLYNDMLINDLPSSQKSDVYDILFKKIN